MIILAVVVIIALIVVSVLGGIPGIGGSSGVRASASYWRTADIAITNYVASNESTNNVRLTIKNNLINPITITSVKMSVNGQTEPTNGLESRATNVRLGTGSESEWKISGSGLANICNQVGDAWVSNVEITYRDEVTGATFIFTGDGRTLQGKCAKSLDT